MLQKSERNRQYIALLIVISFVAISIRIFCFRGFVGLDDAEYAKFSYQISQDLFSPDDYSGPAVFPLRTGLILPTSVLFHFFGVSEWTMVLYPIILSFLGIFLIYSFAAHLFSKRAGIIAASFWTILPIDIMNSTKLLPDGPGAFYASLATVGLIALARSGPKKKWPLLLGGILIGLIFGISWLCKESVVYYMPFCIYLFLLTLKNNWQKELYLWIGVAIGSIGVLISEMSIYYFHTGDWMFRFHEIERNYHQCIDGFFTEGSRWGWPVGGDYSKALIKRLFVTGPQTIFFNNQFLYLTFTGLLVSCFALYKREKTYLYPSIWLITLCLMFNFASSSSSSYAPLALFNRYLYPVCFPAIILTAAFLDKQFTYTMRSDSKTWKKIISGLICMLFFLYCSHQTYLSIKYGHGVRASWTSDVRKISQNIPSTATIYTDAISKKALEFFKKYSEDLKIINFEGMKSSQVISPDSYIFIQKNYLRWLDTNAGMWLSEGNIYRAPPFAAKQPNGWEIVYQSNKATLFQVQ